VIDAGVASQVAQLHNPIATSCISGSAIAGIVGTVAATVSALFAFLNWRNGRRANAISASSAWKMKLMGYVVDEVSSVGDERKLVMQILKTEHGSKESKWGMVKELTRLRDESQRRIYTIESMSPGSHLTETRDAIDISDDSFIMNEELRLRVEKKPSLCNLAAEKYDKYAKRLNEFARSLNK
jgi:hypothetical protein